MREARNSEVNKTNRLRHFKTGEIEHPCSQVRLIKELDNNIK